MENNLTSGFSVMPARPDLKKTKRTLEFDDEIHDTGAGQMEAETKSIEIGETEEKIVNADLMNEKKRRLKSSSEGSKSKTSNSNKRWEEKERKAYLEQLHVDNQRLLRESRGVSFKPLPLVQKPVSSILKRIRQRKIEMSKKFSQDSSNDLIKEDDNNCLKQDVIDHSKSIEIEVGDLSESVKKDKVSSVHSENPESDEVGMDAPVFCGEQKIHDNAGSQMVLNEDSTPVI